jgi:hypothetical protein
VEPRDVSATNITVPAAPICKKLRPTSAAELALIHSSLETVIARIDRANQYSKASLMDREALGYWATRSSRVVTVPLQFILF